MLDGRALLLTADFFTPMVDDPYDFGRVAAANALSDIYAMGGTPLAAMNLVAFPCSMDRAVVAEVLRGGADKVIEAGGVVVGGHTIDDEEPKYGLSVLGVADPDEVVRNVGAQPGDVLVLTKRLGVGIMNTALKRGLETEESLAEVIDSMARLNAAAADAMRVVGVHAATDVTGFGLLGHLHRMAEGSGTSAEVDLSGVPVFAGARDYAARGVWPGRAKDVVAHVEPHVEWGQADEAWRLVLCDPQTSGGLLMAVASDRADELVGALAERGEGACVVGRMTEGPAGRIVVR